MVVTASELAATAIDQMLILVDQVRVEKHRDPLRALEDRLLEMRTAVTT